VKFSNSRQAFVYPKIICLSCLLLAGPAGGAVEPDIEDAAINPLSDDESALNPAPFTPIFPVHIGRPLVINQLGEIVGSTTREPSSPAAGSLRFENLAVMSSPDDETYLSLLTDINQYEEALREREESRGAWDPTLAEELMAMGRMLQAQGDYNRALEIFTRAAHISRINHGLISMEQIAPVESMVETYIALNQWAEADRQQRYAFYVQTRAY
jgi:tetratricopeptide (TPR) repeat protein